MSVKWPYPRLDSLSCDSNSQFNPHSWWSPPLRLALRVPHWAMLAGAGEEEGERGEVDTARLGGFGPMNWDPDPPQPPPLGL